jgi:hypothetical protein
MEITKRTFDYCLRAYGKAIAWSSSPGDTGHPLYPLLMDPTNPNATAWLLEAVADRRKSFMALFLLHELNPDADAVSDEHRGYIDKMREDWLAWGVRNGYKNQ